MDYIDRYSTSVLVSSDSKCLTARLKDSLLATQEALQRGPGSEELVHIQILTLKAPKRATVDVDRGHVQ